MIQRQRSCFLLLTLLLYFNITLAQESKKGTQIEQQRKRKEAKDSFESASAFYKTGEYEKALENFKLAYSLTLEPSILFNIGQCQRQLNQFNEAIKAYKTFLRESPQDPLVENANARIKELEEELNRLKLLGSIQVFTNPDGARVFIDDKDVGTAPIQAKNINSGEHTISVKQEGFYPYELRFELQPGQAFSIRAPLRSKDERDLLRPKYFYLTSAGTGTLGSALGITSLLFAIEANNRQLQPDQEFEPLFNKSKGFSVASQVLLSAALVAGTSGFFLSLFEKKAARRN
jgi:hypothetical protein